MALPFASVRGPSHWLACILHWCSLKPRRRNLFGRDGGGFRLGRGPLLPRGSVSQVGSDELQESFRLEFSEWQAPIGERW
jgi:hypothetical protein